MFLLGADDPGAEEKPGMAIKSMNRAVSFLALCVAVCLFTPLPVSGDEIPELESSFNGFLGTYIKEIKSGNTSYLKAVHPKLPEEQYDFFLNITLNMMKYAHENTLSPTVTCREFNICKAVWPQPANSWAAQSFIRHEGVWRWLDY